MALVIDKFGNIIVNAGGKAHRTGWVVLNSQGKDKEIAPGFGYHAKGVFRQKIGVTKPIPVNIPDLTVDQFKTLTGWTV